LTSTFAGSTFAPGHFVAVDTETTGINPERDVVIEVAIVVFDRDQIVEQYSQTIDPGRKLPLDIVRLTGLTDADLRGSPRIADVRATIRQKIGALPVVAHNVDFDVAMLEKSGVPVPNRKFDTYRLATLLMPNLAGYGLTAVADALEVVVDIEHRALADALRAARVFQTLLARIDDYDERTLNQAALFAQQANWPEASLFRAAADRNISGPLFGEAASQELLPELRFLEPRDAPKALQRTGSQAPIHIDGMLQLLSPGGPLSHVLTRFESRPTQVRMAGAVGRALNDDRELLVEAGTGTGKSLAYLLPAAVHAIDRGERVVVSTNTLALQDQLYGKDLPDLRAALLEHGVQDDLRVAVMKGRANYLCLQRWFEHMGDPVEDAADAALRAKILLWLPHTETGDKAELRLTRDEERHWRKFASEKGRCTPKRCPYARIGQCFLYRARVNALNAHLVIANHSLVLSNAAQGFVLPQFERLIVDEAHHLEEEATSQFSWSVDRGEIEEPLRLLVHTDAAVASGLFDNAATFFLRSGDLTAAREATDASNRSAAAAAAALKITNLATELFARMAALLPPVKGNRPSFSDQLRLTEGVRDRNMWTEVSMIWGQLDRELMEVLETGRWFLRVLDTMSLPEDETNPNSAMRDDLTLDLQNALEPLATIRKQMLNAFATGDGSSVYWIERSAVQQNVSINGAPLDVSAMLRSDVFNDLRTCVLTSATLSIDGSFDYIADRLGMDDATRLLLGSPFDHERSTMVYIPDDMPDPKQPNFQDALNESLIALLRASGGRALILFTSHAALRTTLNAIKGPLARHNIAVLGQGIDGSFRQLVDRLRSNPGTALLGTSSYWEGVDVVGPALSLVAIVKLPFPVPSDPVFEARCELSPDPFNELSVPKAVLKFKQGFGRLIRSDQDRGICVVYDRRIVSRRYGQSFLHSLPQCTVSVRSLYDLPDTTGRWLDDVASASYDPIFTGDYR
jgi:DNA polymerase-3 subunit epsilon/ATP-dependent DNA helicase DinG